MALMPPWKPGQSGNPGGKAKRILPRIDEMCQKDGKHPYTELMKLLPDLRPKEQADVWLELLAYCVAKPKEYTPSEEDILRERISAMPMDQLIIMVRDALPQLEMKHAQKPECETPKA